jgi:hypothetical protein
VGSLLCSNLEEELVRLSLRDHISARETPGKEKNKPGAVFCQGVSLWDEPRMTVATKYCERCNRWFCQALSLPEMLSGANAFEISDIERMNIGAHERCGTQKFHSAPI